MVKRERAMRGDGLTLTLATVEHYLDNVYVQDHTYTNRDQCEIVEDLVTTTLKNHRFISLSKRPRVRSNATAHMRRKATRPC